MFPKELPILAVALAGVESVEVVVGHAAKLEWNCDGRRTIGAFNFAALASHFGDLDVPKCFPSARRPGESSSDGILYLWNNNSFR